jgi:hypothetical protein
VVVACGGPSPPGRRGTNPRTPRPWTQTQPGRCWWSGSSILRMAGRHGRSVSGESRRRGVSTRPLSRPRSGMPCLFAVVLAAGCSNSAPPPRVEVHTSPGEGVFEGVRWRFDIMRVATGEPCRTVVILDGVSRDGGDCIVLRGRALRMIEGGIDDRKRLMTYESGLLSSNVKQLRIVFQGRGSRTVAVQGDAFVIFREGRYKDAWIEALDASGGVLAKCDKAASC